MTNLLQRILPTVQKPARYTGGEYNEIKKDLADVRVRIAFCFPDTYEIGMSNVGMRILYGVMNEMDGVWCERVFAPWGDMEDAMRANNLPLWALESQDPVKDFDMIAFTIGYEMCYTNILNMLRLAGIPLRAKDRTDLKNIVFAGGVCAFNPEPLADFVDFFSLGEGEEITKEIVGLYDHAKAENWSKEAFLLAVSKISGVYVPPFYEHTYNEDGTLSAIIPCNGAPECVTKRIIEDLDKLINYSFIGIATINLQIEDYNEELKVLRERKLRLIDKQLELQKKKVDEIATERKYKELLKDE